MSNIYLIGGLPRCGKTTAMKQFMAARPIANISSDALQFGMRNVLIGAPPQLSKRITFEGTMVLKEIDGTEDRAKPINVDTTESDMTYDYLVGLIAYHVGNELDIAIEGASIWPGEAARLRAEYSNVKAVFVGYTNASQADVILRQAAANKPDWIADWVESAGSDAPIRKWVADQAEVGKQLKSQAEQHGFAFHDIGGNDFNDYLSKVVASLCA